MDVSKNRLARRRQVLWILITVLAFGSVNIMLLNVPSSAIQHWYLFYSPMVVAALQFGLRGALIGSAVASVNVLVLYFLAIRLELDSAVALAGLLQATNSMEELRLLAFRIADLRAMDPTAALARATGGGVLIVIGNVFLGVMSDRMRQEQEIQRHQVEERLGRYFSPQLVRAIVSGDREVRLGTVRKEVTVLFADLRGFTSASEHLEPEDLSHQLNEYLSAMTDVIFKYDGTLDKYIGDAVMAFFGDPVPHKDHAERALRAALEMRDRFLELRSRWVSEGRAALNMGIGVNTGYVTVGNVGSPVRLEYTVVGSNVDVAQQLSDTARADQILVTSRTYRLAEHIVEGRTLKQLAAGEGMPALDIVEITGLRILPRAAPVQAEVLRLAISRVLDDGSFRSLVIAHPERALPADTFSEGDRRTILRLAMLRGSALLSGVSVDDIFVLLRAAALQRYSRGTVIINQGDQSDACYIIAQGDIAVVRSDDEGNEQHIATLERGACFGELAPLQGVPRTASIRACSDLELFVLNRPGFEDVRANAPELYDRIQHVGKQRAVAS